MPDFGKSLFSSLVVELLVAVIGLIVKDDKKKLVLVLTFGTMLAGVIGFGGQISSNLGNIVFSLPVISTPISKPVSTSVSTALSNNQIGQKNISILKLENLTLKDPGYDGDGFFDITIKNNDSIDHAVGIRFWYEENKEFNDWIVRDQVIARVPGMSEATSRIIFRPGNFDYQIIAWGKLQAEIISIDGNVIYTDDEIFNNISLELISKKTKIIPHTSAGNLECTLKIKNNLPIPIYLNFGYIFAQSYMSKGQQVSRTSQIEDKIIKSNQWAYVEPLYLSPLGDGNISVLAWASTTEPGLKSLEVTSVLIDIADPGIVGYQYVRKTVNISGCAWALP